MIGSSSVTMPMMTQKLSDNSEKNAMKKFYFLRL